MRTDRTQAGRIGALGLLLVTFACSAFGQTGSYDWSAASLLYPGVKYAHYDATTAKGDPRKNEINVLQIDLTTPNLRFYTTPRYSPYAVNSQETLRQTTRTFVSASQTTGKKVVVAINANGFDLPSGTNTQTKPTDLKGLAVSEGVVVSPIATDVGVLSSFLVSKQGVPSIVPTPDVSYDLSNVQTAVSGWNADGIGSGICLYGGSAVAADTVLYPRTAIGTSQDNRYVYFMTIDGRQTASQGVTTLEQGNYLKYFGGYEGLNVDDGGSTTMAWWNPSSDTSALLNVPVGNNFGTVGSERTVGNNIGIYYVPEPSSFALLAALAVVWPLYVLWLRRRRAPSDRLQKDPVCQM